MTRSRLAAGIAAALLLILALFLHTSWQPAGKARVSMRNGRVRVHQGRIGFHPRYLGSTCLVDRDAAAGLLFHEAFEVLTADAESVPAAVRFSYRLSDELKLPEAGGDWCHALPALVKNRTEQVLRSFSSERIVTAPRESGREAAARLEKALRSLGIIASETTVRLQPPAEMKATLPIPSLARLATQSPRVVFIGLDGADWSLLDRYIAEGSMPNLGRMLREGGGGVLKSQTPPLSPLLWNTMMTGAGPIEHGILDFVRFNPKTGVIEPITSDSRKVPAIWNMATWGGKSVAVFGLWATYPAEPVRGTMVSDRLLTFLYKETTPPPGIVYPAATEPATRELLRRVESEIGYEEVREYLPWLAEDDYKRLSDSQNPYAQPESALRRILVETTVYDRLARETLRRRDPDLTVLYLQGTDSIGHVFAPFAPPKQEHIAQSDFDRYEKVSESYFRAIDRILGDYMELVAERQGVLMLASDHGFRWSEGRPKELSSNAMATAAKWHSDDGMFLLWGSGITGSGNHARQAGIEQVCATLLDLAGLPPGQGLAGPSLRETGPPVVAARSARRDSRGGAASPAQRQSQRAPRAATAVDYQSYFAPGAAVATPTGAGAPEALAKLRALGYVGAGERSAAPPGAAGSTRTAGSYNNEGLIRRGQKRITEAIAAFEKATTIDPALASAAWNLSDLLFEEKKLDRSDELLVQAVRNGLSQGVEILIGRAIGYQRRGDAARSLRLMESAVAALPRQTELRMFRGRYRIEQRDCAGALEDFRAAQADAPNDPNPWSSAGLANLCLGRPKEAAADLRRSLSINPAQPQIRRYLATLP